MSSISIIAYIILALSVGYAFVYPSMGEVSILMDEKEKYETSLEMVNNIENKKNELLTEFNKISAEDKKDIDTVLPNSLNFVRLVSQISSVASKYNIVIDKTSYRKTSPSSGESIGEEQSETMFDSAIINFSFSASYPNFKNFTDDLEKSLRILDIRNIKITTGEKKEYIYEVEFETYWLKS
ncbi:MAG: hypothetical protein UR80_C0018G0007 [Parcubacteria group bacterium GW2011_GWB1_35_5]|uniref:Pilus assembly protein PilO n=1 Tax=Candidatus Zambryskibacteria bacterium RIFCSPLOWO2_01_FULL_35_19 TaxID=1802757 RepID=A0A1G2TV91_9BACT|nr:MAG: hypothetical protein UR50_C0003G0109 [Parcubacteria group bacterium GW2011_GWC1_34_10]KKP80810.1 MAG: hypothetical protein UR80_C0018G0007 [Parcubacteria group bacterium GW2011_GWB1_35_5]OHA86027.1 MAG: hypothetical protein A2726_01330 [Candidatus Zambryskibacteria bacterium RIFCSPHIGHO2_01_FULL_35_32]OHB01201.1 MAG: hypothetical protein A3A90_01615 [Candidatus Zambryskibacteria bacterium RIFCSPLOWO2_01_FULL_35_19]